MISCPFSFSMAPMNSALLRSSLLTSRALLTGGNRHASSAESPTVKMLIDGKMVESETDKFIDVHNPATQDVVSRTVFCSPLFFTLIFSVICSMLVFFHFHHLPFEGSEKSFCNRTFFYPDLSMKISSFSKTVHTIFIKFCTVILHPEV